MSKTFRQWLNLSALAVLRCILCAVPSDAAQIFYTDPSAGPESQLKRINPDGSGMVALVTNVSHPRGIGLDILRGKIYWNEPGLPAIRRANLDGTKPESVVATSDTAAGLALDVRGGKIYWTGGNHDPRIKRANLDGTGIEDLITSGQVVPGGIALDNLHGKLYWTDLEGNRNGTGSIKWSDLNGSNVETLLTGIDEANGIACDAVGGKIYWTEATTKKIQRANLDGTGVEDLVVDLINPTTISLDLVARKMYWTDSEWFALPPRIQRSNLDGSNVETVISGVGFPWGITVDDRLRIDLAKAVRPTFPDLIVGTNYQLQLSYALNNWTNYGPPFIATNRTMLYPQYFDVENWGKLFFRLQTVP